jgi:ankyrin repeat protein
MARNNLSANTALDEKGLTGLHLAAMLGKPAVVASLAGDADVNLQNKNGWTALMLAARNGYLEIVQMLLRAGADPGLAARNGATARSFAKRNRHSEVVLLLVLDKAWPAVSSSSTFSLAMRNSSLDFLFFLPSLLKYRRTQKKPEHSRRCSPPSSATTPPQLKVSSSVS